MKNGLILTAENFLTRCSSSRWGRLNLGAWFPHHSYCFFIFTANHKATNILPVLCRCGRNEIRGVSSLARPSMFEAIERIEQHKQEIVFEGSPCVCRMWEAELLMSLWQILKQLCPWCSVFPKAWLNAMLGCFALFRFRRLICLRGEQVSACRYDFPLRWRTGETEKDERLSDWTFQS